MGTMSSVLMRVFVQQMMKLRVIDVIISVKNLELLQCLFTHSECRGYHSHIPVV